MEHRNDERAVVAKRHVVEMQQQYSAEIEHSIKNSTVYRIDYVDINSMYEGFAPVLGNKIPLIEFQKATTQEAINSIKDVPSKKCALNFASYKYPGGGFINGSMAQEESLCHDSTLYNVISADKFALDYDFNRNHLNDGMYSNWSIYSPDIVFERNNRTVKCDVITCPAPNMSKVINSNFVDHDNKYYNILYNRIKFVLDVCNDQGAKVLILGAFGCGVFKNSPSTVGSIFARLLKDDKYNFDKVIFAIPDEPNYTQFKYGWYLVVLHE
jgi:uncharacterized protein (TIGR02452 family)